MLPSIYLRRIEMEYKLEDYEQRIGKSRHIEVKINCEVCGKEKWVKWTRRKRGQARYCSLKCANIDQERIGKENRQNFGKENAAFIWDDSRNSWTAYWKDIDTGKQKTTTKARWLWEQEYGKLPRNMVVAYKDGNPKNCELDNLKVISRSESNSIHLQGHKVSDETRQKLSEARSGKVLSEEHKESIRKTTKKMWDEGVFDDPKIREAYARQGRSTRGSKHTPESRRKMSKSHLEFYKNPENYKKMLKSYKRGAESASWRGGASKEGYPSAFSKRLRSKIRRRDKQVCRLCGEDAKGIKGGVHHIDANKHNNDESNLILVCNSCHGKIHGSLPISDPIITAFRSMLHY